MAEEIPNMKLVFKAFVAEFQKLNNRLDEANEWKKEVVQAISENNKQGDPRNRHHNGSNREQSEEDLDEANSIRNRRAGNRVRMDSNINSIKMQIPPFKGRNDAEAYLEWKRKVEMIFACHNYSEGKKVKLAVADFSDYALVWWDELVKSKRRYGERPIETSEEMKRVMKKRFVPSCYYREVHRKLHRFTQVSKLVEDYHKEMEMLMIKADIEEDIEVTIARFMSGLNKEITDVVEVQLYVVIEDLVSMAMKVERQQNQRRVTKAFSNSNSKWGSKWPKYDDAKKNRGSSSMRRNWIK